MKKSQLRNIIRESIKGLMNEQSQPFWYTAPMNANWGINTSTVPGVQNTNGGGCQEVANWSNHMGWVNNFSNLVSSIATNNGYPGSFANNPAGWTAAGNPQPCNMIRQKIDNWWIGAGSAGFTGGNINCGNYGTQQCNQVLCKLQYAAIEYMMWGC